MMKLFPPLPPKDDPMRYLALARRSIMILAILTVFFGIEFVIEFGIFNRLQRYRLFFEIFGTVAWLGPGVGMILCINALDRRRPSAAMYGLIVVGLQTLIAIGGVLGQLYFPPLSPVPLVVNLAWVAALVQTLIYLRWAMPALRVLHYEQTRGFEVSLNGVQPAAIDARPVQPTAVNSDPPA